MADPLFVFPEPRAAVSAELNAAKVARWPTATISTSFPSTAITVPHIQHAWDGTPTQQANRQNCAIRITAWTPKGQLAASGDLAQLVLAVLLDSGSASIWRFRDPVGPIPGIDDATGLPFCTFTLTCETRPSAVA